MKKVHWRFCGVLLLAVLVAGGALWLEHAKDKQQQGHPYGLVSTFKQDARTSRAFTWETDGTVKESVIELMPDGEYADFSGAQVLRFTGVASLLGSSGEARKRMAHKAEATGLQPGTIYKYRVGSGADGEWSSEFQFQTEPQETAAFSFIHVTDSQGLVLQDFKNFGATLNKAFALFPDARFIIHSGDLTEEPENLQGWDDLFAEASAWVTRVPLMPVTGNHDEQDKQADVFTAHFNLPDNGAEGAIPGTSYSFNYGNAHFVVLDTESNIKKQTEWLQKDLAAADREWIIASIHRPAYGGNQNDKTDDWVALFDQYHVDLVLQGHNHEYSRSFPLKEGKVVQAGEGTVYVVTNASGSKFNEKKSDKFYHAVHFQNGKQMFAGITVNGTTLSFAAYDIDGSKQDEFVLRHE